MSSAKTERQVPAMMMSGLVGNQVLVRLKWGSSYVGTLISSDNYMNVLLKDAQEQIEDKCEFLGDLLIRCNNILYVRKVPVGVDLRRETA